MGIGHVALAFASKRFVPQVSLGWLLFATLFVDELFAVFVLLGLERGRIVPGATEASPFVLEHYPVSHSLVANVGWALALGALYWLIKRDRAGATVLAVAVLSHWFLDVVAHVPDVPVLPSGPFLGFGLWNSLPATLIVEAVLVGAGVAIYAASTNARDRIGRFGLWTLAAVIGLVHLGLYLGPIPASMNAAASSILLLIVPVLCAHWIDAHRNPTVATRTQLTV